MKGHVTMPDRVRRIDTAEAFWRDLYGSETAQAAGSVLRLIWAGRLAEVLIEEVARLARFRKRVDYEVVAFTRRMPSSTPLEIAAHVGISPSGMTGVLDRLEDDGLIRREPDVTDRRAVRISLTDEGLERADQAILETLTFYQSMLEPLNAQERAQLDALLTSVMSTMEILVAASDDTE